MDSELAVKYTTWTVEACSLELKENLSEHKIISPYLPHLCYLQEITDRY
jgi:hypothetical protein